MRFVRTSTFLLSFAYGGVCTPTKAKELPNKAVSTIIENEIAILAN
jgi:hypothetical protein